jgi:hypothetical protein
MVSGSGRRELLVSKGWVQAVALVVLFGFFVLGLLAYQRWFAHDAVRMVLWPGADPVAVGYYLLTQWSMLIVARDKVGGTIPPGKPRGCPAEG